VLWYGVSFSNMDMMRISTPEYIGLELISGRWVACCSSASRDGGMV
jgi:hypothetical protein